VSFKVASDPAVCCPCRTAPAPRNLETLANFGGCRGPTAHPTRAQPEASCHIRGEAQYWAEGVQDWYFTNLESNSLNGIHNNVDRREELLDYDPMLDALIEEFLAQTFQFVDCYSDE